MQRFINKVQNKIKFCEITGDACGARGSGRWGECMFWEATPANTPDSSFNSSCNIQLPL